MSQLGWSLLFGVCTGNMLAEGPLHSSIIRLFCGFCLGFSFCDFKYLMRVGLKLAKPEVEVKYDAKHYM